MAENRGGKRPSAPQNGFGVSATGGAGNGGQPARYIAGGDYGEGKDLYEMQSSAPMSGGNPASAGVRAAGVAKAAANYVDNVVPLNSPTQRPEEPMTAGVNVGAGGGSEIMSSPAMVAAQNNEDIARIATLLPMYARIAESPQASNSMRNFYRWLRSQV